jgi:hypothetical protein
MAASSLIILGKAMRYMDSQLAARGWFRKGSINTSTAVYHITSHTSHKDQLRTFARSNASSVILILININW